MSVAELSFPKITLARKFYKNVCSKIHVIRTNGLEADTKSKGEIMTEGEEEVVNHIRRFSL